MWWDYKMAWTPPRTWLPEKITVDKLNLEIRDKFDALKDPPHAEYAPAYAAGTLISTSSTSFVTMTGFSLSLTTTGGDVLIILNVSNDSNIVVYFDIEVNNSRQGGTDGILGVSVGSIVFIPLLLRDIEPQTLTIVAKWKVPSGLAEIRADSLPYFSAREIS
jgi:hypothetical protein